MRRHRFCMQSNLPISQHLLAATNSRKPVAATSEPGPRFQSAILAYVILQLSLCRRAKFLRLRRQASQLRLLRFMGITLRDAHRTSGGPALEKPRTRRSADYMYLQDRHQCSPQFDNNLQ